jgi:hypothetical protein
MALSDEMNGLTGWLSASDRIVEIPNYFRTISGKYASLQPLSRWCV